MEFEFSLYLKQETGEWSEEGERGEKMIKDNRHRPIYSLPQDTIVAGRYLIQDFLEERENRLIYLAYDLAGEKQIRLTECYPKQLVERDGENGEESLRIHPGKETEMKSLLGRFGKEDRKLVDEAQERACKAVELILSDGPDAAMNEYNKKLEVV